MTRIATWNVNSLRVRLPQVLDWCHSASPDIVALQEIKLQDEQFPLDEIQAEGYQAVFAGQKTYNGVAILSREPATDIITDLPGLDDPQRRLLAATIGDVRVINVYVPNGQAVDSDKYRYKLEWLARLRDFIEQQLKNYPQLILLGDFNIAPDDRDVHDPEAWAGKILCSEPERAALKALLDTGLQDSYRLTEQEENEFSWWDYRMNGFKRNLGLRIDLVLASKALCNKQTHCIIDKEPRGWERPSDHTPVTMFFDEKQ
jgi:exodeoxyribonuclease-3